jgi:hypothetical protein
VDPAFGLDVSGFQLAGWNDENANLVMGYSLDFITFFGLLS